MSARRDAALFVALAAIWGTSFVAIKAGLADLPPLLFAAVRYDVAGVLVLAYAVSRTPDWRPRTRADWAAVGVSAALLIAAYNGFLFVGEQGTTSAAAAVLVATSPILTTVVARLLLPDQRLTVLGTLGLLLGFVGVGLVARPDPDRLLAAETVFPALVVLAAVSVALGSVVLQRLDHEMGHEGLVAWANVGGALLLHAASLAVERGEPATASPTAVLAVLYLAVLASAVGYVVYFGLLDRLGAVEINLISYATPVPAAIAGWLLLAESLTAATAAGFLVILAGFVLVKRRALRATVTRYRN